jgi:hypothetical protein
LFASELHINIEGSNEKNFSAKNIKKTKKKYHSLGKRFAFFEWLLTYFMLVNFP